MNKKIKLFEMELGTFVRTNRKIYEFQRIDGMYGRFFDDEQNIVIMYRGGDEFISKGIVFEPIS